MDSAKRSANIAYICLALFIFAVGSGFLLAETVLLVKGERRSGTISTNNASGFYIIRVVNIKDSNSGDFYSCYVVALGLRGYPPGKPVSFAGVAGLGVLPGLFPQTALMPLILMSIGVVLVLELRSRAVAATRGQVQRKKRT